MEARASRTSLVKTRDMVYIGVFATLITVCSWISIPTTVPFTLQTLGIFTAVGLLGGKRGTLAVLVYILLGAIGVPVFAGFTGGVGALVGTTGGYIAGFLFTALVMWGMERAFGRSDWILGLSMAAGLVVCYAVGTAWFLLIYTRNSGPIGLSTVLAWCVVPFIVPDLIKMAVALLLTNRLKRRLPW